MITGYSREDIAWETLLKPNQMRKLGLLWDAGRFHWQELPGELVDQIGGYYNMKGDSRGLSSLSDLNDGGVPFDLIADVIEAEPKGLFWDDIGE